MTTPPSSHRATAQPGLWCASLFLVIAGLFGMHGLANLGPCDMPPMIGTTTGETALPHAAHGSMHGAEVPAAAHRMTAAVSVGASVLDDVIHANPAGSGHRHGMVGLCLAVLVGALIALALLNRRPARGMTVPVDRRRVRLHGLGRDRDPPSLTWLSIRRC